MSTREREGTYAPGAHFERFEPRHGNEKHYE